MSTLIEQNTIDLQSILNKVNSLPDAGEGTPMPTQEKSVNITANGTVEVTPDDGYTLSKVIANVNVTENANTLNGIVSDVGTFIVDEDASAPMQIEHNLGVVPNFSIVYVQEEESSPVDYNGYLYYQIILHDKFLNKGTMLGSQLITNYGASENSFSFGTNTTTAPTVPNSGTHIYVYATSTFKLKAGVTYHYVCGVIPGLYEGYGQ